MLKLMRETSKSLQWILWFVIASFVVTIVVQWGAGGGGTQRGDEAWAAKVGDVVVTQADFHQAFQRQEEQLRSLLGADFDRARFMNAESILNGLIDDALMRAEAADLGLSTSPPEVARFLRSIPAFQGPDGRFARAAYEGYLSSVGQRPPSFERSLGAGLLSDKIASVLEAASVVSSAELEATFHDENDTASIEYVLFPPEASAAGVTVTSEEIAAKHAEDPDAWDAGPGRQVRVARFEREAFQAGLEDEAQMRAYHAEQVGSIYTMGTDQRRASAIRLRVEPQATPAQRAAVKARGEDIARRARRTSDFAALARELSEDEVTRAKGGDLGPFYRLSLDPALEDAAFSMREGEVRGPIETAYGFEVIRLTKGTGEKPRSYDEVRDLIARALYTVPATEAATAAGQRFREALSAGSDFAAAAATAGIAAPELVWITRDEAAAQEWSDALIEAAFTTPEGGVSPDVVLDGGHAVVSVVASRATSPRTAEAARPFIEAALREEKAARAAEELALAAAARVGAGEPLSAVGGAAAVEAAGPFRRRQAAGALGVAADLSTAAFGSAVGGWGMAKTPRGPVAFVVTDLVRPEPSADAEALEALRRRIEQQRQQALRRSCLDDLRKRYEAAGKVSVNADVLAPFQTTPPVG